MQLRNYQAGDDEAIVRLNAAAVQYTSPMDVARLAYLQSISDNLLLAVVDDEIVAFLLVMRESCAYRNENFEWFSACYSRFVYVDRIVVDPKYADQKIASMMYTNLFERAEIEGIPFVACEYNIVPPNKRSSFFHRKFGFVEVGTQWLANNSKQVSLQVAEVPQTNS